MSNEAISKAKYPPNDQQLKAIEAIWGPVLVVAGPGTGKTELLSLRVAHILENCDVGPQNILCLTYTDAGAQAMAKRLSGSIGKAAYEVRINTFHAFSAFLKNSYLEFFDRSPFDALITALQSSKVLCKCLMELSISDALYQRPGEKGVPNHINAIKQLIGRIKKSGLTSDQLRAMAAQSLDTMDYLEHHTDLGSSMWVSPPGDAAGKADFYDTLKVKATLILENLPSELLERKVSLPGSYEPYGLYLSRLFKETTWCEGRNTEGFRNNIRKLFEKDSNAFVLTERRRFLKLLSALVIFDQYEQHLAEHGLYDYDDMILDAVKAIENNRKFQQLLQAQYLYILVDEFQDTNGSQMRLLELLTEGVEAPNILAVGDDDQAIMRFQGASVVFLKQFEDFYADTKRIVLLENYRSTPSLVDLGQDIAVQIQGREAASKDEKKLVAVRAEATPQRFTVQSYATQELQYFAVTQSIRQRIDEGFIQNAKNPNEAIAVIAPKHKCFVSLIPYLKLFDIAYTYDITETVGRIETLQGFIACIQYVSLVAEGDCARASVWLPQILAARELGVPAEDYVRFALDARSNGWITWLMECSSPAISGLADWLAGASQTAAASSAQRALRYLAEPFVKYYHDHAADQPFALVEFNYGYRALLDFVEGEARAPGALKENRTLKLGEVRSYLDAAQTFDVNINVTVPVSRPESVSLKTAHGSKGLEYDLVYLLDVDNSTWYSQGNKGDISCPNIYLSERRDDDDVRRLLFVAVTRARYKLEMSRGRSATLGELLESVVEVEVEPELSEIVLQSQAFWEDSYYPNNQHLNDLVFTALKKKSLSASFLNDFIEFNEEVSGNREFIIKNAFRFPQEPTTWFEFGTLAHRYLELYLKHVVKGQSITPSELLKRMHAEIDRLDFKQSELSGMHERLDLIEQVFIPASGNFINENALSEQWINAVVDDVPLTGRSDLLMLDASSRTLQVGDYKTGKPNKLDDKYRRQLVFYKILIEESGLYPGWTVSGGADIFVEPDPKTRELAEAHIEQVSDEEVAHVRKLIKAVHWRIQNTDFDTSTFLPETIEKKELQRSYELWLIQDHEKRLTDTGLY